MIWQDMDEHILPTLKGSTVHIKLYYSVIYLTQRKHGLEKMEETFAITWSQHPNGGRWAQATVGEKHKSAFPNLWPEGAVKVIGAKLTPRYKSQGKKMNQGGGQIGMQPRKQVRRHPGCELDSMGSFAFWWVFWSHLHVNPRRNDKGHACYRLQPEGRWPSPQSASHLWARPPSSVTSPRPWALHSPLSMFVLKRKHFKTRNSQFKLQRGSVEGRFKLLLRWSPKPEALSCWSSGPFRAGH